MAQSELSSKEIQSLLRALDLKLQSAGVRGEVYLVGGAVMCLAFNARPATKDVDAYFKPAGKIREMAAEIAEEYDLDPKWLNDAVKGFLSANGEFDAFLDLNHLKVFIATPEYLLAMKCLSMRLGFEFSDEADVRYLLRYLNIDTYESALATIKKFYPLEQFPQKTLYALEELLKRH